MFRRRGFVLWRKFATRCVAGALLYFVYGVVARCERNGLSAHVELFLAVGGYALHAFAKVERYVLRVVDAAVQKHYVPALAVCELRHEDALAVALQALELVGHLRQGFCAGRYAVACVAHVCGLRPEKHLGERVYLLV